MRDKIYIGTAYYPEHWPSDRWEQDIKLMKEAGIHLVRLAELAWSFLEPEDGIFDFSWLDTFVEMAYANGIETVLGTPTEITPTWMNRSWPEVIAIDDKGQTHGGRGNHCYHSPALNRYTERLVTKMAEHYKDTPGVIGWQIDNELRGTKCFCMVCRKKYREWLQDRYASLENLNTEWGTCFWSQVYHSWEEVELPSQDQLTVSTSQILDHFRFASHSAIQFLRRQADIIKAIAPHQFVSHNSLGLCEWVNLFDMADCLDDMGLDSYPYVDDDNFRICMAHDLARGTRHDNYWIWEQKNGYVNYHTYNLAIDPGLVRLWTYQDIARGACGVVYYRFRSNRYNYEQNPNGILRHDGTPRGVYFEIQKITEEMKAIGSELADTKVEADAAILYSYEQMWDEYSNKQYKNLTYQDILLSYYKAMIAMGLTVDLVDPKSELGRYKLVIAPGLALVDMDIANNLKKFVMAGGYLVLGVRSGIKTWSGAMTDLKWPGLLSELAGIKIDEFEVLPADKSQTILYQNKEYTAGGWLERLKPVTARAEAEYGTNFYAGEAAVTVHSYGKGMVRYVGAMECDELVRCLLEEAVSACKIEAVSLPEGVFMTRRRGLNGTYRFIINNNRHPVTVSVKQAGINLLTGKIVRENVEIPALDLVLLK